MIEGIPITAESLAGTHKSYAEKTLAPDEVFRGKNYRQNKEGGRYPRPGFQDSEIDLSSFSFTAGRGLHSSNSPKRLWLAADTGAHVKIVFVDTDPESAWYGKVYDTGLTLQTGYYVQMLDFEGDIYYANGYNTVGRIIVGQVGAGGVAAAATDLNLKTGNGVRFAATGTGKITNSDGTMDTFTWGGKTADQLTTVADILAHVEGDMVIVNTTITPVFADKASVLAEWLASLNLAGDPDNPRVWEFSQFANASDLSKFYTFGSLPGSQELLGEGGAITGLFPTKNFMFVLKTTGVYSAPRSEVDGDTGARIPSPIRKGPGLPNPRCIAEIDEDVSVYLGIDKRLHVLRGRVENGESSVRLEQGFDSDIEKDLIAADIPDSREWVTYNDTEKLLKVCVMKAGVRYVYVRDFNVGKRGVWYDADQGKNYDVVVSHEGKTWAFDGAAEKLYIDETGNYDDLLPVECEWETGRMGRGEFNRGKAKDLRLHGFMMRNSSAYLDFYRDGKFVFTKILTDERITDLTDSRQIGSAGVGSSSFGSGGDLPAAFPFRWPIGVNKKGEDFRIKVRIIGENGDFVQFDGYTLTVKPLTRHPHARA